LITSETKILTFEKNTGIASSVMKLWQKCDYSLRNGEEKVLWEKAAGGKAHLQRGNSMGK